uniref:Uncharacterized protein n=1 Tax=Magnetococcus massalia (strain MO-1) TaxID=451514 RepID=A0A1S7LMN8_MAGMO|nr:conserved exported protein of unknown function [Candidatus Magnetococcus massalia]
MNRQTQSNLYRKVQRLAGLFITLSSLIVSAPLMAQQPPPEDGTADFMGKQFGRFMRSFNSELMQPAEAPSRRDSYSAPNQQSRSPSWRARGGFQDDNPGGRYRGGGDSARYGRERYRSPRYESPRYERDHSQRYHTERYRPYPDERVYRPQQRRDDYTPRRGPRRADQQRRGGWQYDPWGLTQTPPSPESDPWFPWQDGVGGMDPQSPGWSQPYGGYQDPYGPPPSPPSYHQWGGPTEPVWEQPWHSAPGLGDGSDLWDRLQGWSGQEDPWLNTNPWANPSMGLPTPWW